MVILQSEEKEWTDVYELINEYEQRLNESRQGAIYGDATSGNKALPEKTKRNFAAYYARPKSITMICRTHP